MRCTYMYSFKCGAMERNEVDLDWIYIYRYMDGYESGRREEEEEEEEKKRNCGSSSREERMLRYLGIYLSIA